MLNDNTDKNNLKVAIRYVVLFIVVVFLIMACGVLFGSRLYSNVSDHYDVRITNFHDHRL